MVAVMIVMIVCLPMVAVGKTYGSYHGHDCMIVRFTSLPMAVMVMIV